MRIQDKVRTAVVKAFLNKHPNYTIKAITMPGVSGGNLDAGTLMGIAAGNPSHLLYVSFRHSSTYIGHGFLEPMEELLARVKSENPRVRQSDADGNWLEDPTDQEIDHWREQIKQRVADSVWPVIHREAETQKAGIPPGEHVWFMPITTLVRALIYRKDVFKQAGLNPDAPPDDWAELLACARRIKTLPNTYGISFMGDDVISWDAYSLFVSNGVHYMKRNDEGQWYASFNKPGAAETIYYLLKLTKEPFTIDGETYYGCAYVPILWTDISLKWEQGQIGMRFTYLSDEMMLLEDINPELVGIAPMPKSPAGMRGGEVNCEMLGVYSQASPAQKLAVMEYIWFFTGEEAQKLRVHVFVQNGYGKFINPFLLEKYGYNDIRRKVPKGWRETFEAAMESGVPEPYGKNTQFIYDKVSDPILWAMGQGEPLLELPEDQAIAKIQETLDTSAERVNRYMLGRLPPEELSKRRVISGVVLGVIALLFGWAMVYVWRAFTRVEKGLAEGRSFWRYRKAYLLILPALLIVVFWQYLPVLMGAPLALFDYELVIESSFAGIDNFATILFDSQFWMSLAKTFYWVILAVGLGFWPPILLAILLDEVPTAPLKYIFRTVFFLPTVVSGVIMIFLWRELYDPSESGAFNRLLLLLNKLGPVGASFVKILALGVWLALIGLLLAIAFRLSELSKPVRAAVFVFALALLVVTISPLISAWQGPSDLEIQAQGLDPSQVGGWTGMMDSLSNLVGKFQIKPLRWIEDPGLAMLCCVLPIVWATAGPGCIIYLAALKTVPEELVEAASIDGAGILQKICYITLPRVKFLILIQLIGAIVANFKGGVNLILAMTGGGPNGATRLLSVDIYERTFMELKYGIGAAMAWVLGAIVIGLTAYQLKRMSQATFSRAQV